MSAKEKTLSISANKTKITKTEVLGKTEIAVKMPSKKQTSLKTTNNIGTINKLAKTLNKAASKKDIAKINTVQKSASKSVVSKKATNKKVEMVDSKKAEFQKEKIINSKNNKKENHAEIKKTPVTNKTEQENKIKVLYVVAECQPFCAVAGLGEVGGSLPRFIAKNFDNVDMRVIVPLYGSISDEIRKKFTFLTSTTVKLSWREQYCGVFKYVENKVTYYFLDNEYYFGRENLYGYFDDAERFAFMSKAVLDILAVIDYMPDVIHTNDWHSALVPIYLKTLYKHDQRFNNVKTVFTIHNINYQGEYSLNLLTDLFGISKEFKNLVEYNGKLNLVKGAICASDMFNTVSPTYAQEIKTAEFGFGLETCVNQNSHKLVGILNGIDYEFYNPSEDEELFVNYNVNSINKKSINKQEMQKLFQMQVDRTIPLIGMNCRLIDQKGIDLIQKGVEELLCQKIQLVVMGSGEIKYEQFFKFLENKYKGKVVTLKYNNDLAKKIYAASDIILMPSKFEPCGVTQMIASRYGAIPIVRETGGLKDTIRDFGCVDGGNGFTFAEYNYHDLVYSIKRAINEYNKSSTQWESYVKIVMKKDFSWLKTGKEYVELYKNLMNK